MRPSMRSPLTISMAPILYEKPFVAGSIFNP